MGNQEQKYTITARMFHWAVALLVFSLLAVGWYMGDLPRGIEKFRFVEMHKSFGLLLLALMTGRSLWRAFNPPPPLPDDLPSWEKHAAKLTHWALYGLVFLQVFAGMSLVWTANSPLTFFGLLALPAPMAPDKEVHELLEEAHEMGARLIALLALLHIGAALRHHFILKNNILRRMLGLMLIVFGLGISGPAGAALWNMQPASQILFHFVQSGGAFTGQFQHFDARIDFDPQKPEDGRIDVMIDVASLDTQNEERDAILRSGDIFDVEQFPQAQFKADTIRQTGTGEYEAVGALTIRDVSRPLNLPFSLTITDADDGDVSATAHGKVAISRRDYELGKGEWAETGIIADEVIIEIRVEALQQR